MILSTIEAGQPSTVAVRISPRKIRWKKVLTSAHGSTELSSPALFQGEGGPDAVVLLRRAHRRA
jgi:hypothetical protein